jgi:two-component system OmpR family response regulator
MAAGPDGAAMTYVARILVADDSDPLRVLIAYALASEGHTIVQAADGRRAQELLTSERFEVAVLDVMMPGIDGLTLCSWLRETPDAGRVSVVIVSAATTEAQALAAGADAFLGKPFRLAALRSVVRELAAAHERVPHAQKVYDGQR